MKRDDILSLLKETGAWKKGHFLLSSGRHGDQYIQCAKLFENPLHGQLIGKALAEIFADRDIDTVAGPAMGGILLAYDVGRSLGKKVIFAERAEGKMTFRRGFELSPGEKVLLVEDVITTGGSIKEVAELIKTAGAEVVAMGCIVRRKSPDVEVDLDVTPLIELEVPSYAPDECPLCKEGTPAVKPGSRPGKK